MFVIIKKQNLKAVQRGLIRELLKTYFHQQWLESCHDQLRRMFEVIKICIKYIRNDIQLYICTTILCGYKKW